MAGLQISGIYSSEELYNLDTSKAELIIITD